MTRQVEDTFARDRWTRDQTDGVKLFDRRLWTGLFVALIDDTGLITVNSTIKRWEVLVLSSLLLAASIAASHSFDWMGIGSLRPTTVAEQVSPTRGLRDVLMDKFHAMNAADKGIFHDDISYVVAPYFPAGQSITETKRIIQQQQLGSLRIFKGEQNAADGTMYVTKFSLMDAMFSNVDVMIDFDFDGRTEADMVLRKSSAYIHAANM